MTRYAVIHRPKLSMSEMGSRWNVMRTYARNKEDAVRRLLTDRQILKHEFEVMVVKETLHSDDFHHDGTFDDVCERVKEKKVE